MGVCPPGGGGGRKVEGGTEVLLLGSRSGSGGSSGGGGDPLGVVPPPRPQLPCGASIGIGLCPLGPAPMPTCFPCPALTSCHTPGLPATEPAVRPGPPARGAVQTATHASGRGDPLRLRQPPHAWSRDIRSPACWCPCCLGVACVPVPATIGNSLARCPTALARWCPMYGAKPSPGTHVPCLARTEKREPPMWPLALELVDCSTDRASGQHNRRCTRWYGRRGGLPVGAGGKNPPRKSAMGVACSGVAEPSLPLRL